MTNKKLGTSTSSQRRAILANLLKELIIHERIETTELRAKELKRMFDRTITFAKKGTVEARRDAIALVMNDKKVIKKVFDELGPRFKDRNGGYTRILKLKERRGDNALMVIIELV